MDNQAEYYVAYLNKYAFRQLAVSLGLVLGFLGYAGFLYWLSPGFRPNAVFVFVAGLGLTVQVLALYLTSRNAEKLAGFQQALAAYRTDPEAKARMQANYKNSKLPLFEALTGSQRILTLLLGLVVGALAVLLLS